MASLAMDVDPDYLPLPDEDDDYREDIDIITRWLRLHGFRIHSFSALPQPDFGANLDTHTGHNNPHAGVTGRDDPSSSVAAAEVLKTVEPPGDGRDCPICMDDGAAMGAWKETPCGHGFHGRCVERWLQAKGSCPVCRRQLLMPPAAAHQHVREM